MRDQAIRLSESEKNRLEEYRDQHYHETVPFGYVVAELLEEAGGGE